MWLWMKLFGHPLVDWRAALTGLAIAVILAAICAEILSAIVRRSLARSAARGPASKAHARTTVRFVRAGTLFLLTAMFLPPALEFLGQPVRGGLTLQKLWRWVNSSGPKIFLIASLAYVVNRIVGLITSQFERHLADDSASTDLAKRARTLGDMARNAATVVIATIAILYILKELEIDILPLLTTAGIAGLAVGFGAQTLVKDIISGFFLILDDQVRVGDVAEINGVSGVVEGLHLRTLVLRDSRGALHFFPTGSITTLANLTKDFSYALLDLHVEHKADTEKTLDLLPRIATDLQADPAYHALILEPLEIVGVDNQGPDAATIRIRLKTMPMRQWEVARELRRRIRKEVGYEGIDMPIVQPLPGIKAR
jgi:moderate conductance mechanosensitive channel